MAMWGAIIAAAIGAATTMAVSSMKGGAKAPASGSMGGSKGGIVTPDIFGGGGQEKSLLGGGEKTQPVASLSQSIAPGQPQAQMPPPQYGSTQPNLLEEQEKMAWLKNLMNRGA